MPDLNDLDLNKETGISQDSYEPPSDFFRPDILPGEATFTRRGEPVFSLTKDNHLQTKMTAVPVGKTSTVDFAVFTTPSQFRSSTSADDYVRACGSIVGGRTVKDYRDAILMNAGPFNAVIKWVGWCKDCEEETIGAKRNQPKFPLGSDGVISHIGECPKCGAKIGAKPKISRYVVGGE